MTKASRVSLIGVLLLGVLCLPAGVSAQQRPAIADKIAKTYGFDSWGQVEAIRYTYNLEAGPVKLSRSWVWEPKTGRPQEGGPLLFSTDKRGTADGKPAHVFFSNVAVKLVGSSTWMEAQ